MRIIVAGAGNIGKKLIEELSAEEIHNITVVDKDEALVNKIIETCDIQGVTGNCASSEILKNAGIEKADLLIACTEYDELNILCCMIAQKFKVKDTIARVRQPEYASLFTEGEFGLSKLVNPEYETAMEISRILRFPSAIKIEPFASGRVEVVEVVVTPNSRLDGLQLKEINSKFHEKLLICAVNRNKKASIPNGEFVLQAWDEIYLTASPQSIAAFFREMGVRKEVKNVMIAGGSRTAYYLADELQKNNIKVKIIEVDEAKAKYLESEMDSRVSIIIGDATDQEVLAEEGLKRTDAFIALCNLDEKNIVMSLLAAGRNGLKVIAKVDNPALTALWQEKTDRSVVSLCTSTVNEIIRYVRGKEHSAGGEFSKLYRIIDDQVEILEFIVSKDFTGIGVPIKDLQWKKNTLLAAIVRNGTLIVPGGSDTVEEGDTVLIVTLQDVSGNLNEVLRR